MLLKEWDNLPYNMKNDYIKPYYDILAHKKYSLVIKRVFDIVMSLLLIILLSPILLVVSIIIKLDSKGPVFFRQERITQYGKVFKIFKFRTMVTNAEKIGSQVTVNNDNRVTRCGKLLRKIRLDEIPQLFNILLGEMTFVGTRPEVSKYVSMYSDEMNATLLMPAGVTSLASIKFKDEQELLTNSSNVDKDYVDLVLPKKMAYNLEYIKEFNFLYDISLMAKTIIAVLK